MVGGPSHVGSRHRDLLLHFKQFSVLRGRLLELRVHRLVHLHILAEVLIVDHGLGVKLLRTVDLGLQVKARDHTLINVVETFTGTVGEAHLRCRVLRFHCFFQLIRSVFDMI